MSERDAGLVLDGAVYNNLPVSDDFYALFIYGSTYEYFTDTTVSIDFLYHSHSICHETSFSQLVCTLVAINAYMVRYSTEIQRVACCKLAESVETQRLR